MIKENETDAPTPESISFSEGERRQATIVFSDLSGYTSMNERLDPEEVEAIMSRIKQEAVRSSRCSRKDPKTRWWPGGVLLPIEAGQKVFLNLVMVVMALKT